MHSLHMQRCYLHGDRICLACMTDIKMLQAAQCACCRARCNLHVSFKSERRFSGAMACSNAQQRQCTATPAGRPCGRPSQRGAGRLGCYNRQQPGPNGRALQHCKRPAGALVDAHLPPQPKPSIGLLLLLPLRRNVSGHTAGH